MSDLQDNTRILGIYHLSTYNLAIVTLLARSNEASNLSCVEQMNSWLREPWSNDSC